MTDRHITPEWVLDHDLLDLARDSLEEMIHTDTWDGEYGGVLSDDIEEVAEACGVLIYRALVEYLNEEVSRGTFGIDHNGERIEQ